MAKNFRRIFAMVLVLCMILSALPMQALAAEGEAPDLTVTDTISGGSVEIIITPSNESGDNVSVSGVNGSDATVNLSGTSSTITETTTTSTATKTTATTEVHLEGTETVVTESGDTTEKTVVYDDKTVDTTIVENDGTVTEKTVTDGSETKTWEVTEDEKGDLPVDVVLTSGEITTGTANVEGSEKTETFTEADGTIVTENTHVIDRTVQATTSESEITVESTGSGNFNPIQTDHDMIYVEENQLHTHPKTSYCQTSNPNTALQSKPEDEQYDFLFIGQGQMSDFYVGTEEANGELAHSGALQFELLYDPTVENGNYVKNKKDLFTAYCVDLTTGAEAGYWYKMDNLEDAGYYSEEAAAQIRSIVSTGYWGSNPGEDVENPATGSLEKLKQTLKEAGNSGLTDEEIDQLTPGQALAATQAAIWSYANAETDGQVVDEDRLIITGYKAPTVPTDDDFKKAMAVYTFLRNLAPTEESKSTDIIDKESFIQEDSMSITVGEKVADVAANADENQDNDVYNVAVNFALVVTPTEDDDLVVQVVRIGANGETIVAAQGRIAGDDSNDSGFNNVVYDNVSGTYSLKDLQLAENSDFNFDLKLVGTQYLQEGVYIFNSEVRNGASSQTFVGLAEGDKEVNVKQNFVISFNVDESNYIVEERVWHYDNDPTNTPSGSNDPTPAVFRREGRGEADPAPQAQVFRLNNQDNLVEIPEEPVPLATPVVTGDNSGLWGAVILMSVLCMVAINVFDKKKQHETF